MKKALFSFALALVIVGTPLLALAASGQKAYQGTGQISVGGIGSIHLEGTGNVDVDGNGTLSVSRNARVEITGEGEKSVQGDVITYTGFNGSARIWGANIIVDVSGEIEDLTARGTGLAKLEGDGSVKVKKITTSLANKAVEI